jgi:hypothetical protein
VRAENNCSATARKVVARKMSVEIA